MDANRLGRLYKGEEYDIDIKIPYSGETFNSFELQFFTDSASTFTVPFPQLRVEGDIIHANIQENDFDLLADGVLRYYIDYIVNDVETILSTNTMHYLKTPDGYSGKTAEDIYNEGYTSGSTDGYNSGYSDGENDQKEKLVTTAITVNGIYTSEDGFSSVIVNVEGGGSCNMQTKNYNITENGSTSITPDTGYDGITGGTISVNVPSAGTTNLGKTINITSNGTSQVSTSIEHTFNYSFPNSKTCTFTLTGEWPDGKYYIGDVIPEYGGGYIEIYVYNGGFVYDDDEWDRNVGDTYFTAEGTSALTVIVDFESRFNSLEFNESPDEYAEDGTYILGSINVNVDIPQSGHTDAELEQAYTSGYTGGKADQKALMTPITATTNGTYTREDGYSSINVNVAQTGHTDAELEEAYTSGYTGGEAAGMAAQKALMESGTFTSNGTYSRDNGYSTVYVNVAQTGHTDEDIEEAYTSGYTAGIDAQKELMTELYVTSNGTYTSENGFSTVVVNIDVVDDNDFHFLARTNGSTVTTPDGTKYSTDKTTWVESAGTITLNAGQKLYVRTTAQNGTWPAGAKFETSSGGFDVCGSLTTLLGSNNITTTVEGIFDGCQHIVDASKLGLPQINKNYAYRYAFRGCTSLTKAPVLPTPAQDSYYYGTFYNCSSLTTAPELPGRLYYETPNYTISLDYVYAYMFKGCTSLVYAPQLPETHATSGCYSHMFEGCTALRMAPELNASYVSTASYSYMFKDCTSLVVPPSNLPANILEINCYSHMFDGCSSLRYTPTRIKNGAVPDDYRLKPYCYEYMFANCTSLETNDFNFNNSTLQGADCCYQHMFQNCTSLKKITMSTAFYNNATASCNYMFDGCSSLNDITIITCDWDESNSVNWVRGVASEGTFTKWKGFYMETGNNGIPSGWTVVNID